MSGIIVSEANLKMLRKGAVQTVRCKASAPAELATRPKPPWTVGKSYAVQLKPFTRGKLRVILLSLDLEEVEWCLTIKPGTVETPRFLAANPGAMRADYTTVPARALHDEGEVLDEPFNAVVARHAQQQRVEERARLDALASARDAIRELERTHPEERGRLQRLKAQVARLQG